MSVKFYAKYERMRNELKLRQLRAESGISGMTRSRHDELHDRFFAITSSKHGTRYERLAAVVLKGLHEQDTVIHSISLRGASKVPHQIDVVIETEGNTKRVLIEAKDFDRTGKKLAYL
jgi:hypothetical protein